MTGAPEYTTWRNNTNSSWWKDPGLRRSMVHVFVLYLCVFTFGYDGSLLNGLQTLPQWQTYFNHPAGQQLGLISASFYFPKIVTPVIASWIADRFGRRWCLLVGSVISVAGGLVQTFANGPGMFMGGRAMLGGGLAFQATIAPPLIAEICHPRLRSVAAGTYLCTYYVGSTTSAWLCYGLLGWSSTWAWRLPCLVQILGTFIVGVYISCGLMVESPRWLFSKGRDGQACTDLARMHANGDADDELVTMEIKEIKDGLERDSAAGSTSYLAFFKTPGNRKRLLVVIVLASGTQLNGIGLVSYYLSPILKLIGITNASQQAGINGGLAIWNLIVATTAAQFVERLGRRPLWLIGNAGMLAAFAIVTGLSGSFAAIPNTSVGTAVIPFLYIFYGFYDIAWTVLPNLYIPEIVPYALRSKAMSVYVVTQAVSLAFNQYVNPIALAAIAWKYYFVYIAVIIFYLVFAYFFLVETRRFTIEEVSRLFDGKEVAEDVIADSHRHPGLGREDGAKGGEEGEGEDGSKVDFSHVERA
ncbi:hypothetical protein JCM24511_06225 [Saitozyma sp. JCM 24511]|nr:hypothetical protein JCM24511_06225 [Saitozyma sp. JCM 24511]